jgi:hypothetical protein
VSNNRGNKPVKALELLVVVDDEVDAVLLGGHVLLVGVGVRVGVVGYVVLVHKS